jgi:hypothetical protein
MKNLLYIFISLIPFFISAQVHEYNFDNTLNGVSGPNLIELNSCGSVSGDFSEEVINTIVDTCTIDKVFCFEAGGGFEYPNLNFIDEEYTIHVFFRFNAPSIGVIPYSRVIDFSDGLTDAGIYLLNDCLNFYPNGNVGICPFFDFNYWYLMSFVRDSSGLVSVYVDGILFGTYDDSVTDIYKPTTSSTPITFFTDDIVVTCENSSGCVKYVSISPIPSSGIEVFDFWTDICTTIAPEISYSMYGDTSVCQFSEDQIITFVATGSLAPYTFNYTINNGTFQSIVSVGDTATVNVPSDFVGSYLYQLESISDFNAIH